jgi:hypothetical protein
MSFLGSWFKPEGGSPPTAEQKTARTVESEPSQSLADEVVVLTGINEALRNELALVKERLNAHSKTKLKNSRRSSMSTALEREVPALPLPIGQ